MLKVVFLRYIWKKLVITASGKIFDISKLKMQLEINKNKQKKTTKEYINKQINI